MAGVAQDILDADSAAAVDLTAKQSAVAAAQAALAQAQADLSTSKSNDAAADAAVVSMLQALGRPIYPVNPDGTPKFNNDGSLSYFVLNGDDPRGFTDTGAVGGNTPYDLQPPPATPPADGSGTASTPPDAPAA